MDSKIDTPKTSFLTLRDKAKKPHRARKTSKTISEDRTCETSQESSLLLALRFDKQKHERKYHGYQNEIGQIESTTQRAAKILEERSSEATQKRRRHGASTDALENHRTRHDVAQTDSFRPEDADSDKLGGTDLYDSDDALNRSPPLVPTVPKYESSRSSDRRTRDENLSELSMAPPIRTPVNPHFLGGQSPSGMLDNRTPETISSRGGRLTKHLLPRTSVARSNKGHRKHRALGRRHLAGPFP